MGAAAAAACKCRPGSAGRAQTPDREPRDHVRTLTLCGLAMCVVRQRAGPISRPADTTHNELQANGARRPQKTQQVAPRWRQMKRAGTPLHTPVPCGTMHAPLLPPLHRPLRASQTASKATEWVAAKKHPAGTIVRATNAAPRPITFPHVHVVGRHPSPVVHPTFSALRTARLLPWQMCVAAAQVARQHSTTQIPPLVPPAGPQGKMSRDMTVRKQP